MGPADDFVFGAGISVFFPAYNDAPSLPSLLSRTFEVLRRHARDYEVIVVNDGSADGTAEVLEELQRQYAPYLLVITHPKNRGYGGALRSGFAAATKDFVFYTDGDGQYDPADLIALLREVTPEVGLANGYKIARRDPWHRVAIGWLYNRFARFLFGVNLRDIDCDFRLIRRNLLDRFPLTSTSGTICVELVHKLELLAPRVVELPVHHYPRQHGRSQFFRIRSLLTTFLQLVRLFFQLVLLESFLQRAGSWNLFSNPDAPGQSARLSRALPLLLLISALASVAYLRSLTLPFISDDYIQIRLAREYGPAAGWPQLAADALYRCRATSLLITYWTEQLFGLDPLAFKVSSLLLHVFNSWLVFALGGWNVIGWRVSAVAACFFALCHQHQEAVIWYAALPELLVFFFSLLSFLFWLRWLGSSGLGRSYIASLAFFVLALLSKESAVAVIPIMALAVVVDDRTLWKRSAFLLPFAILGGLYFFAAHVARGTHLHFNDGTFSLSAPFWLVIWRSTARLLWFWGWVVLAALAVWRDRQWRILLAVAAVWVTVTLLPYSFLTYMPFVPSRHTYFASVGLALVIAAGLLTLAARTPLRAKAAWIVAGVILVHHSSYLWTKKHQQFVERAEPTERLIEFARDKDHDIFVRCFPYGKAIAETALEFRVGSGVRPILVPTGMSGTGADTIDLCSAQTGQRR